MAGHFYTCLIIVRFLCVTFLILYFLFKKTRGQGTCFSSPPHLFATTTAL